MRNAQAPRHSLSGGKQSGIESSVLGPTWCNPSDRCSSSPRRIRSGPKGLSSSRPITPTACPSESSSFGETAVVVQRPRSNRQDPPTRVDEHELLSKDLREIVPHALPHALRFILAKRTTGAFGSSAVPAVWPWAPSRNRSLPQGSGTAVRCGGRDCRERAG